MKARDSEGEGSANADEPKPMPTAPVQKQAIKEKRPPKSDAVDPIPPIRRSRRMNRKLAPTPSSRIRTAANDG
jgi:hypothetical protein